VTRYNRIKELHVELPQMLATVEGRIRMVATKLDGSQRTLADFRNLITDAGLNRMGIGQFRNTCVVGTGSNAPSVSDSQLQTTRARTSANAPNIPGATAQSSPPYFAQTSTGFRFSVGSASGNLTEVGIGWSTGSGLNDYQLWSRALIKDENGNPTTVTVLGDEVLDIYYSMRIYPPTLDETYQINIGGETYNCISRAASVTSTLHWGVPNERVLFTSLPGGVGVTTTNGLIGAITGSPSGNSVSFSSSASITNLGYVNNSLQQDATFNWGLDQGNLPGGIRSVHYQTLVGAYQTQFTRTTPRDDGTTTIDKDNTKVLSIGFRVGWGRRP
jgi:hypothetical protein